MRNAADHIFRKQNSVFMKTSPFVWVPTMAAVTSSINYLFTSFSGHRPAQRHERDSSPMRGAIPTRKG